MGSDHSCLPAISLDSAFKKDENYSPQVILKEYKYIKKEKKVIRHITNDLEIHSHDSDEG